MKEIEEKGRQRVRRRRKNAMSTEGRSHGDLHLALASGGLKTGGEKVQRN